MSCPERSVIPIVSSISIVTSAGSEAVSMTGDVELLPPGRFRVRAHMRMLDAFVVRATSPSARSLIDSPGNGWPIQCALATSHTHEVPRWSRR